MPVTMRITAVLSAIMAATLSSPAAALVADAAATRAAPDRVDLRWTVKGPVDVLVADRPDADAASATLVSRRDRDGRASAVVDATRRPYFLIREADGTVTRVAERLVPLEHGSNFRDVGGYPAADGRHVRWGLIYRSGASAMLTPQDQARVAALGLHNLVDLRSDEERVLAPTRIDHVPYAAVGYSMKDVFASMSRTGSMQNGGALYRDLPVMLAPQLRILFGMLVRKDGPVAFNCSAGQDRTGFTTAMILSALGVPRDVILKDYHLSTTYRQPAWEMPPIDPAAHPNDPVAKMFAQGNGPRGTARPQPLYDADGKSFLTSAFAAIDERWGSVDAYLDKEIGIGPLQIQALRAAYTE